MSLLIVLITVSIGLLGYYPLKMFIKTSLLMPLFFKDAIYCSEKIDTKQKSDALRFEAQEDRVIVHSCKEPCIWRRGAYLIISFKNQGKAFDTCHDFKFKLPLQIEKKMFCIYEFEAENKQEFLLQMQRPEIRKRYNNEYITE